MLSNLTTNAKGPSSSDARINEYDSVKHIYNCDLNCPRELFPTEQPLILDERVAELKHRLDEIVGRRDEKTTRVIDGLIKQNPSNNRYFIAVGFGKNKIPFDWKKSLFKF